MKKNQSGINTRCTHTGNLEDERYRGAVSPIYVSTSYAYEDVDIKRYPRYFNTPNQEALCQKMAALENTESALIFGSGMAAVSTALLAFVRSGDHVVLSEQSYGGTQNLIREEFDRFNIAYTFIPEPSIEAYRGAVRENTRVLYLETPSNPLMQITDLEGAAALAREKGLITMIDNTFASPVNQNPADFGIDIIIHSATKYMGGHSDICAGVVMGSETHIDRVFQLAKNMGGSLSDYTVWLLERSIKTMGLRVKVQSENALALARFLIGCPEVGRVYYPGLEDHPDYELARKQMKAFGGMLSFDLAPEIDLKEFTRSLNLVKASMSLAGVESTLTLPSQTSHALLSEDQRKAAGITDGLIRFSSGIEDIEDLKEDLKQALRKATHSLA